jgi:hypothetical protein
LLPADVDVWLPATARLLLSLSLPAATCRCNAWRWMVVVFFDKQKQQRHHQQLTNGSTILKTFMYPNNLDLFKLIYSIFWINFSKYFKKYW